MYIFITSTTYAQWLPGDKRGFVSWVNGEIHNKYGEPYDKDIAWLKKYSTDRLKGKPILLNDEHAKVLFEEFQRAVAYRNWTLHGLAIMPNHFHILLEVRDDAEPAKVAGELKSYGSRRLNTVFGKPDSGTWWTAGSSVRRKKADAIPNIIRYIKNQHDPLLIWIAPEHDTE